MDWLTQNKLIKWLIGILLVVNIVTISALWFLISNKPSIPENMGKKFPTGIGLLQQELNLSDEQAALFEKFRKENFEKTGVSFEKLNEVKNLLFEQIIKVNPDTLVVNDLVSKINGILTELEISRFNHFRDLLNICNEEQKKKFIPVIKDFLFGGPPQANIKNRPDFPEGKGMGGNLPPPPPQGAKPGEFDRPR